MNSFYSLRNVVLAIVITSFVLGWAWLGWLTPTGSSLHEPLAQPIGETALTPSLKQL